MTHISVKKILFGVCFLFLGMSGVHAQFIRQIAPNYFMAGVPTAEFEYMRATSVNKGAQIQSNWCWAACVQMTLNYHGLYVTQMDVVTRIFGSPYVNRPAGQRELLTALSGWAPDTRGRISAIHADASFTTPQQMVRGLSQKWPLIVGLSNPSGGVGHAYVMTGIYYSLDVYGNPVPDKVVLRDPWPTSPSRQEMSWNEFASRAGIIIKVWVNRI
ncbi:MAG: hypothetical protein OEX02_10080 [Cyclobacteriaceae bacterium]|nr:hypothetical protein [Cyclobacteriaceae bacterium]